MSDLCFKFGRNVRVKGLTIEKGKSATSSASIEKPCWVARVSEGQMHSQLYEHNSKVLVSPFLILQTVYEKTAVRKSDV